MEWRENGTVLSVRRHGETSAIVDIFTRRHGRHLGLVRGGRSRRLRAVLQPGNGVQALWRARLSEHLGHFTIEPEHLRAASLMSQRAKLAALNSLCQLAALLPEREAHPRLYDVFVMVLEALEAGDLWPAMMARWELGLLDDLGFGLDLGECAATGRKDELIYVSPKSARAVSASAGEPYKDRLLALPAFLLAANGQDAAAPDGEQIVAGFALTGFFLQRHVWGPRGLDRPLSRETMISGLAASP